LFIKDYDIPFEDKTSEPMPRDHMNAYPPPHTHTHKHTFHRSRSLPELLYNVKYVINIHNM